MKYQLKKGDLFRFERNKCFYKVLDVARVNFTYFDYYGDIEKARIDDKGIAEVLSLQEDGSYKIVTDKEN